jgi:DNA recombination protein RmuC
MELGYLLMLAAIAVVVAALLAVLWVARRLGVVLRQQQELPALLTRALEDKHLAMIKDVNSGLNAQSDRLSASQTEASERLRGAVSQDLKEARDAMLVLQLSQTEELSTTREAMSQKLSTLAAELQMKHDALRGDLLAKVLERLAEQSRAEQELIQTTLRNVGQHLASAVDTLSKTTDARLEHISGRVNERLEEGFKKTNETFASVMARLATIDEAQKKIDGLTTNVVSLQELLGDKRSRGAFGEVQLEALITNLLPPTAYVFQYTLSNGSRSDCVLMLPEPTGMVALDSKFPLENYHRMFESEISEIERLGAKRQFRADMRRHIEDISSKYIIPGETSDGAVMFVPAEAVFAEIHAHHAEVVDYAMQRRVWIVSPTTMMAVLNTARAVLKDVETRRQVHIIKDELAKLGREFGRFDQRMKRLADHIRQAHQDAEEVRVTSDKISRRFAQIERVELDHLESVTRMEQALREPEARAVPGQGG